jgi:hypothetical protein
MVEAGCELRRLDEIARGPETAQEDREARRSMAIGGLLCRLKRLIRKGFGEVLGLPRRRRRCLVIPPGTTEKDRLRIKCTKASLSMHLLLRHEILYLLRAVHKRGFAGSGFKGGH